MKKKAQIGKSYFIVTYGCSFNSGDSLKIQNILEKNGYVKTSVENAQLIIINTCAVKNSTHTKIIDYIKKTRGQFPLKKILITGCLPFIGSEIYLEIQDIIGKSGNILHPHDISKLILSIEDNIQENTIDSKNVNSNRDKSFLCPLYDDNSINIKSIPIQISEGCNNECSYCCTTHARGNLFSFSNEGIISQIEHFVKLGIKEFYLTSQDLGNYNYQNFKLHDLLNQISMIKGNFKIRLGMLNLDYLVKYIELFLPIFEDKRFYRFLHIPIQSGNDRILHKMKRKYNIDEMKEIIDKIQKYDPKITFATDIIVGFPTETPEEHQDSLNFINEWKPNNLNISKYSARPNTEAKKMHQLSSQVIKSRSREFTSLYQSYKENILKKWIGWEGEILITEQHIGKDFPFTGRNLYNIPILSKNGVIGEKRDIVIIGTLNNSLIGEIK